MTEYHKIQSIYKRDPENNYKTFIEGDYSVREFKAIDRWNLTEKVDGTNIRIIWDPSSGLRLAGRGNNSQIHSGIADFFQDNILNKLGVFKDNCKDNKVVLYGEGYGPKIQKGGGNYGNDQKIVIFDVLVEDKFWLSRDQVRKISTDLNLEFVPEIAQAVTLDYAINMCKNGFNSRWGNFPAEGVVARPMHELRNMRGDRIITKVKLKDFPNE